MIKVVEIKDKKSGTFYKVRCNNDIRFALAGVIKEEYQGDVSQFFHDAIVESLKVFYQNRKTELDERIDAQTKRDT